MYKRKHRVLQSKRKIHIGSWHGQTCSYGDYRSRLCRGSWLGIKPFHFKKFILQYCATTPAHEEFTPSVSDRSHICLLFCVGGFGFGDLCPLFLVRSLGTPEQQMFSLHRLKLSLKLFFLFFSHYVCVCLVFVFFLLFPQWPQS